MHFIIDFDYTLFDTHAMRERLATAMGVSTDDFHAAEQRLKGRGELYSLETHAAELGVDKESAQNVLRDMNDCLYPDAHDFFEQHRADKMTLLTFGNVAWQETKIAGVRLPQITETIVTDGDKAELARQWANENDIVIVNDRGSEIDAIAQVLPRARFVWVRREGAPYVDEPCTTEEAIEVTTLNNLYL